MHRTLAGVLYAAAITVAVLLVIQNTVGIEKLKLKKTATA